MERPDTSHPSMASGSRSDPSNIAGGFNPRKGFVPKKPSTRSDVRTLRHPVPLHGAGSNVAPRLRCQGPSAAARGKGRGIPLARCDARFGGGGTAETRAPREGTRPKRAGPMPSPGGAVAAEGSVPLIDTCLQYTPRPMPRIARFREAAGSKPEERPPPRSQARQPPTQGRSGINKWD